jgi:hypothetical protein
MRSQLTSWTELLLSLEGQLDQVAGKQEVTLGAETARELLDELHQKVFYRRTLRSNL